MLSKLRRDIDPLDLELLERAFESAWAALRENNAFVDLEADEELEAALQARFETTVGPKRAADLRSMLRALAATEFH